MPANWRTKAKGNFKGGLTPAFLWEKLKAEVPRHKGVGASPPHPH